MAAVAFPGRQPVGGLVRYRDDMVEDRGADYEELRKRFPWIGLGSDEASDFSARYREVMARARVDREAIDAVDEVRRTA